MRNITFELKGDKLVVTMDIGKGSINSAPLTSSGKNLLLASTGSYQDVGNGMREQINLICDKGLVSTGKKAAA